MGIKVATPMSAINRFFEQSRRIIREEILRQLQYLGQECVNKARDRGEADSWKDQTGNLRSSVGMALYEDGKKLMQSAFEQVGDDPTGSETGKRYVEELAAEYANAYCLVIVAAMDYAEYVEAMDNKDVLASIELYARSEVESRLKDATTNAAVKINKLAMAI